MHRRLAFLCVLPLLGCNVEDSVGGLADSLLDPKTSSVDTPGRKIVAGSYSDLELDASLSVGARLLALRHDREDSELAIIPFEGGAACHVGPASNFMRLASQVDVNLPPIVGYVDETTSAGGTLKFVDFACRELMSGLDDVPLPQVLYPRGNPTGFLALSQQGIVHFIDVVDQRISTVAQNVRSGRVGTTHLWLVESGVLIARNGDFEDVVRYGNDVTEFALFSGLQEQGVTDVAYVDGGNLYLGTEENAEPSELAQNVCNVTDIGQSGAFAFYSPCETRQLAIAMRPSLVGLEDEELAVVRLSESAVSLRFLDLFWGEGSGAALFLTGPTPNTDSGSLFWQTFDVEAGSAGEPELVMESAFLGTGSLVMRDYDGSLGALVNVVVEPDDDGQPELLSVVDLADAVAQLPGVTVSSSLGVLGNYDESRKTGDLLVFSHDLERAPKNVAQGVPIQRHARDSARSRSAFVGDFDGATGTAFVLEDEVATALGKSVRPSTIQFLETPDAVAYLADAKGKHSALTLFLLEPELEVVVHDEVNEFHSLPWPSPGVLYSVSDGADQGIWFARAK